MTVKKIHKPVQFMTRMIIVFFNSLKVVNWTNIWPLFGKNLCGFCESMITNSDEQSLT